MQKRFDEPFDKLLVASLIPFAILAAIVMLPVAAYQLAKEKIHGLKGRVSERRSPGRHDPGLWLLADSSAEDLQRAQEGHRMPGGGRNLGRWFEEAIAASAATYRRRGIGNVYKIPTPYRLIPEGSRQRFVYDRSKSTVDFIGVFRGVALAFDAKTVKGSSIPLRNVHQHQLDAMHYHNNAGGAGFLVINFLKAGSWAVTPRWWEDTAEGLHRRSVPLQVLQAAQNDDQQECVAVMHGTNGVPVDFGPPALQLYRMTHDQGA